MYCTVCSGLLYVQLFTEYYISSELMYSNLKKNKTTTLTENLTVMCVKLSCIYLGMLRKWI